MKKLWILVSICIMCIFLMGCNCNGIKPSNNSYSEYAGVYMTFESISYYDTHKEINIVWHNETDYEITLDLNCEIKRNDGDDWINVRTTDVDILDYTAYTIKPNSTYESSFSTKFFDISKKGVYRLYNDYDVNTPEIQHCSAYVEFEVTSVESHKITMRDKNWLFEDLKDAYYENEKVTVKIKMATDVGYMLLANGKKVKQVAYSSGDDWYWEFAFTMPNEDVELEFKTYDGFLQYPYESRLIESYILANPDIESAWIDSFYGEYDSGAIVAIIKSQNDDTEKLTVEKVYGFNFTYPNESTVISVFYDSVFYSIWDAYSNGYLSVNDLEDIYQKHISFFDELYFDITDFPGLSDLDTNADKIVVNFDNYTDDGFEFEITDKNEIREILKQILSARIEYDGEFIAGQSSCQTFTVYKGDKIYEFSDYFVLSNGYYRFDKHIHCDKIYQIATELGAWNEIKTLNDVTMYDGAYKMFYLPDNAISICIKVTIQGKETEGLTFTNKESINEILNILKSAEINNYDSPISENIHFRIAIEYSTINGTGTSYIESSFNLSNRYFTVNTNELYDYLQTIK